MIWQSSALHSCLMICQMSLLVCCTTLDKKKEPSSRFAARRTLFHVWHHARSGAISAGQVRSATVRDFCPALIAPDRAWCHTWNSVLLAANLDDGSFFVQGRRKQVVSYVGCEFNPTPPPPHLFFSSSLSLSLSLFFPFPSLSVCTKDYWHGQDAR